MTETGVEMHPTRRARLERWLGLSGVAYVVLIIVGDDVIAGEAPGSDASADEIAEYVATASDTSEALGRFLALVGVCFLMVFFGRLYATLRDADRDSWLPPLVLGAGLVAAALHLSSYTGLFQLAGATEEGSVSIETARVVLADPEFLFVWFPLAVALLAAGAAVLTTVRLPRWFGWATVAQGVVLLAALFLLIVADSVVGFVAYVLFWLWLIVSSIVLVRNIPER